jgi:prevent-host-death family protein
MKTATVRDLRNNFAELAKHLEWGEEITITRHGQPIATLSPPRQRKRPTKAAWKRFFDHKPLGRKLTLEETDEFWSRLRD